mgnify:CR=1 FL=1
MDEARQRALYNGWVEPTYQEECSLNELMETSGSLNMDEQLNDGTLISRFTDYRSLILPALLVGMVLLIALYFSKSALLFGILMSALVIPLIVAFRIISRNRKILNRQFESLKFKADQVYVPDEWL